MLYRSHFFMPILYLLGVKRNNTYLLYSLKHFVLIKTAMTSDTKYDLTGSIVLYKNDPRNLEPTLKSFLDTNLNVRLYLIDNSPTNILNSLYANDDRVEYIFNNENRGYGTAHNQILLKSSDLSYYHLILNPDVYFEKDVLETVFNFMQENIEIGQIMPKVLYPNGDIQYLCKLLPRPIDLILRRFLPFLRFKEYELSSFAYNKIVNIPNLSGCFMFLRTEYLNKIGGFDTNFFMYLEDIDLTRRMHRYYKTIVYPEVCVTHEHEKGSFKNPRLLYAHIKSAIYYFNKYGWFFDKERRFLNKKTLDHINQK